MIQGENYRTIRVQNSVDQRAHIQYQTDVPEVRACGSRIKGHVAAHQSKGRLVGATGQLTDVMLDRLAQGATTLPLLQAVSWRVSKVGSGCLAAATRLKDPSLHPL